MSPDFLIVGASRGGTTTLFDWLSRHPEIYMPPLKELRFFDNNGRFPLGKEHYESNFNKTQEGQIAGEASTDYFYRGITYDGQGRYQWNEGDDAPIRIKSYYPDIKIIISLRNPAHRAYSEYWKNLWEGRENADTFLGAIEEEVNGIRGPKDTGCCWLYRNYFSEHIAHWLSLYPRENILILTFEEWIRTPDSAAAKIAEFLEVSPWTIESIPMRTRNQGRMPRFGAGFLGSLDRHRSWRAARFLQRKIASKQGYPPMDDETKMAMKQYLRDDIRRLEQLLQMDFSRWLS